MTLNANMLTLHPGNGYIAYPRMTTSPSTAVDGYDGKDANNFPTGWLKCATSLQTAKNSPHWLAIDLKDVFLISRVRATFRYDYGQNAAVFVGNNPSVANGRDDYQCGERWTQNVQRAPHFHNFTCPQPRWASHVSVQNNNTRDIQICEVEVYYIRYTSVGMLLLLYTFHDTTTHITVRRVCCVSCRRQSVFHWCAHFSTYSYCGRTVAVYDEPSIVQRDTLVKAPVGVSQRNSRLTTLTSQCDTTIR